MIFDPELSWTWRPTAAEKASDTKIISTDMGLFFFGFFYTSLLFVHKSTLRSGRDLKPYIVSKENQLLSGTEDFSVITDLKLSMTPCKESLLPHEGSGWSWNRPLAAHTPSAVCKQCRNESLASLKGWEQGDPLEVSASQRKETSNSGGSSSLLFSHWKNKKSFPSQ